MEHCGTNSSLSYHVHKVAVCQESVKTKGRTIHFEISVIDTYPEDGDIPVVIGIHGADGMASDFEPIIKMLCKTNVRFVAPTLPGFEADAIESWKLYHLNYSSAGLSSLIEQILSQLGIKRVSVLMAHSAGAWVAYKMAAELDIVKSLCLVSPACCRPHRALRPQFVIHFLAWLLRIKSLHFVLMPIMQWLYYRIGMKDVKAGENVMVSQQIVSSQVYEEVKLHAKKIKEKQLPLLCAYALNDKLIEAPIFDEMIDQHLDIDKDFVLHIDKNKTQIPLFGTPVDQAKAEDDSGRFAHALRFERGGHIVHKAHSEIIMDHMMQLLAHVRATQSGR